MRRLLAVLLLVLPLQAREIHLAPDGNDAGDGSAAQPWKSFNKAVMSAQPGDTIVLAKGLYRDKFLFANRGGTPQEPITIEGNGALLSGCDIVPPETIEPAGDGRWKFAAKAMPEVLIVDGVFARQGRLPGHRGKPESLPEIDALQPGQWTWRDGWAVVRNDQPTKPALEVCVRDAGFQTNGVASHLIVRNLAACHHWNDGFNIHGRCRGLRFENILGYENMDEGFSAHEWCETDVYEAEFWGNDNGVADVMRCLSTYHRVYTHDNVEVGFLFRGGRHWVVDCLSVNDGQAATVGFGEVLSDDDPATNLLADPDCVFNHFTAIADPDQGSSLSISGRTVLQHCTLVDVWPTVSKGPCRVEWCVLAGKPGRTRYYLRAEAEGQNVFADNLVSPGRIHLAGTDYDAAAWDQVVARLGLGPQSQMTEFGLNDQFLPIVDGQPLRMQGGPGYWGAIKPPR